MIDWVSILINISGNISVLLAMGGWEPDQIIRSSPLFWGKTFSRPRATQQHIASLSGWQGLADGADITLGGMWGLTPGMVVLLLILIELSARLRYYLRYYLVFLLRLNTNYPTFFISHPAPHHSSRGPQLVKQKIYIIIWWPGLALGSGNGFSQKDICQLGPRSGQQGMWILENLRTLRTRLADWDCKH